MDEIIKVKSGVTVKLFAGDTDLDIASNLRINADSIELNAKKGKLKVTSEQDVIVQGRKIRLN